MCYNWRPTWLPKRLQCADSRDDGYLILSSYNHYFLWSKVFMIPERMKYGYRH